MLALLLLRPVQAAFDCSGLITNAATGVDEAVAAHECILNGIVQDVVDASASSARHTAAGGGYNLANVASIWQTFDKKLRLQSCAARSASCRSRLSSRTEVHCRVRPRDGARLGLHRVLRQHERDRRVPDGPDELRRLGVPVDRGKHHGFRQGDDVDAKRHRSTRISAESSIYSHFLAYVRYGVIIRTIAERASPSCCTKVYSIALLRRIMGQRDVRI